MAGTKQTQSIGRYTLSDAVIVGVLGILGGVINVTVSSIPHNHFVLWGARVPYGAFFTLAPVLAMLLVRKTGVAFATAIVYGIVQTAVRADPTSLFYALMEGAGIELVFALFRYRRFDALSAFLAGGIGAKTLGNLWTMLTPAGTASSGQMMMGGMSNMQTEQYAPWQMFLGGEILAFAVVGVLSGLVGWALARLIERTEIVEHLRTRLDRRTAQTPQVPS